MAIIYLLGFCFLAVPFLIFLVFFLCFFCFYASMIFGAHYYKGTILCYKFYEMKRIRAFGALTDTYPFVCKHFSLYQFLREWWGVGNKSLRFRIEIRIAKITRKMRETKRATMPIQKRFAEVNATLPLSRMSVFLSSQKS